MSSDARGCPRSFGVSSTRCPRFGGHASTHARTHSVNSNEALVIRGLINAATRADSIRTELQTSAWCWENTTGRWRKAPRRPSTSMR